jgi:glycosyltransferase involved in cell wall biosynthesis
LRALNLIFIGPFAFKPKGTVSARAFLMARALVRRGHQVTILMPPYDNLADSGRAWEEDGVRLENMVLRRNDAWHQLTVPLRMARRATREAPDAVHVFKPIGYSGLAAVYLHLFSRRPLVVDTDDWEGKGGWSDVNPYPSLWKRLFGWQERWLARRAGAMTVASRCLEQQVAGFGADPAHVFYLPNGPDGRWRSLPAVGDEEKAEVRAQLGVGTAPFALYLGHIPQGTDLDLALEAMAMLGPELPAARLVIAGVGEGLSGLRQRARELGVEDNVIWTGWIEHERSHLVLSAADAVVAPFRDTLINRAKCPAKVVAGMALGKAVVAGAVGQNVEYIHHGHSGLLTAPGDARDLAHAMAAVLSDRELAGRLGKAARERIWDEFDWESRVAQVEAAYRAAGAGRPA